MSSESQELSYYTTSIGETSSIAAFLGKSPEGISPKVNNTRPQDNLTFAPPYMLPAYFQTTSIIVCVAIMVLGIIGNLLVPIVVFRNKDMRNSTNIFLVNLSIADLCVLLICTPTILIEVISGPQVWPLGKAMCIIVPFVELTVAHASVLTILAISFERYYAICEPLRAGYVCTKARAFFICVMAWIAAALCTSPMIWISDYLEVPLNRSLDAASSGREESEIAVCLMQANSAATIGFFIGLVVLFFFVPLIILIWLYTIIVRHLIHDSSSAVDRTESYHIRARRQVILMLLTVVFSFFICLSPFKLLTFYIVVAPAEYIESIDNYLYYNILYFSRIMFYLNSAVNPILYNLMSSKFRIGFFKLCRIKKKRNIERGTFKTTINSRVSSPILLMPAYEETIVEGPDEIVIAECVMEVDAKWKLIYHVGINIVFFTIPFLILTALYTTITRHLIANPIISRDPESNLVKYRRQVVLMLGTVVVSFFCCLLPFRILVIWIIFFTSEDSLRNLGIINFYLVLYVCRFLVYFNSAVNPILYNIMSTKFRDGFQKLCCRRNVDNSSGNTPIRNSRMTSSTPTQITLKSSSAKSGSSTSCTFATTSSIKYNTNIYNDLSINCENNVNIFLTEQNPIVKTDKQSKFPLLIHEKNTITILGKTSETYV